MEHKNIENLSITELKCLAYDQGTIMHKLQEQMRSVENVSVRINEVIRIKQSEEEQKQKKNNIKPIKEAKASK